MSQFSSQEIDSLLDQHNRWLSGEADGVQLNLKDADLSGLNLTDANL
jgi:uncharacterized protein YjbI with pentapeptide repeats